jgi:hypothetical protein
VPAGSIEIRPGMIAALAAISIIAFAVSFWFFLR